MRTHGDVYTLAAWRRCAGLNQLTLVGTTMRTTINIDDELMQRAMKASGLSTKRETVEAGLRLLVQLKAQQRIRRYRGKLSWEGDLDSMRRDA